MGKLRRGAVAASRSSGGGGTPLFVGDYSTGNFNQWPVIQNKLINGPPSGYTPGYPATVENDATYGKAARYEVRQGDNPGFSPDTDRSEVQGSNITGGNDGDVRWYRLACKFDASWPTNHASLGWGLTHQWHPQTGTGSPWVGFHTGWSNGKWTLLMQPQDAGGGYLGNFPIWEVNVGTAWHDIKMEIQWSTGTGYINLWWNGARQNFLAAVGGGTTYTGRTMIPGTSSCYYKEGHYRTTMAPTSITWHAAFKCATTEAGLG